MTRSSEDVRLVVGLAPEHSTSEIARRTGVPRTTVRRWISGGAPFRGPSPKDCLICTPHRFLPFRPLVEYAYSYLLGLYLGDGWVTAHPRGVFRLLIALDRAYPGIIAECDAAMTLVMPSSRVSIRRCHPARMVEISSYSRHWPCVLPQHGRGMKHSRTIELTEWQRTIVDRYPHRFLRGLVHSDGTRSINTIRHPRRTYRYSRYQFSNRSPDIRRLFCEYCDKVGVEWRRMNRWNISVARRGSVELMDRFIGPKR